LLKPTRHYYRYVSYLTKVMSKREIECPHTQQHLLIGGGVCNGTFHNVIHIRRENTNEYIYKMYAKKRTKLCIMCAHTHLVSCFFPLPKEKRKKWIHTFAFSLLLSLLLGVNHKKCDKATYFVKAELNWAVVKVSSGVGVVAQHCWIC